MNDRNTDAVAGVFFLSALLCTCVFFLICFFFLPLASWSKGHIERQIGVLNLAHMHLFGLREEPGELGKTRGEHAILTHFSASGLSVSPVTRSLGVSCYLMRPKNFSINMVVSVIPFKYTLHLIITNVYLAVLFLTSSFTYKYFE